jgi:hypothetical protein
LKHHVGLQCPKELRVVMCEMALDRFKELVVGTACELRPALTLSDPPLLFADHRHLA